MADTSGSVDDDELAMVYSEINGAVEQYAGKLTGKLGFFDSEVVTPISFGSISDLAGIVPYGGGGTDFGCVFNYIKQNYAEKPPACVIIFTDGDGPYPAEYEAMGIPVLWIINNEEFTPPWGKVARLVQ